MRTNREGLTWPEWRNAAGWGDQDRNISVMLDAWRDGEDPSDHRAALRGDWYEVVAVHRDLRTGEATGRVAVVFDAEPMPTAKRLLSKCMPTRMYPKLNLSISYEIRKAAS